MNERLNIHIFVDFDGTITTRDSLQAVLDHFTGTEWRNIEDRVSRNELDEKQALQMEFEYLKHQPEEVLAYIQDQIEIDPSFIPFSRFCQTNSIPLTILSGGFTLFIKTILKKYSLEWLEIYANDFQYYQQQWSIIPSQTPRINRKCNHCKTYHIQKAKQERKFVIYIGDGNTDRCPASQAGLVFAKGNLAHYLERENKFFIRFESFETIQTELEGLCYNSSELTTDWSMDRL
jgi:2,3-diketo-5-methylthio-1-phosphopentane phosphatase